MSISDKASIFDDLKSSGEVSMKEALMAMVSAMTGEEKTFTGKLDYEFVIDPISLYLEI